MIEVAVQLMTWFSEWLSVSFLIQNLFVTLTPVRNVYSLFDYGDFIENSSTLKSPYIQLYSITDMAEGIIFQIANLYVNLPYPHTL
jgi:hypothetical protein